MSNEVVSTLLLMPRLRSLALDNGGPAFRERRDVCAALVGAFASLAELEHLDNVTLPSGCGVGVFSRLTGLACLQLRFCFLSPAPDFAGLDELTNLRSLGFRHKRVFDPPPQNVIARFTLLTSLALRGSLLSCGCVDGECLEHICQVLWHLRRLNLTDNTQLGAGLHALQLLTHLEELGLSVGLAELKAHLVAPPSLRRCMLPHLWRPADEQAARRLFGQHVEVLF